MKFKLTLLLALLLSVFGIQNTVSAQGNEIPISIDKFDFENPNTVLALEYEPHQITLEWHFDGQIKEDDYFDIILDEQLSLSTGSIVTLEDVKINNILVAKATMNTTSTKNAIRYTFTQNAKNYKISRGPSYFTFPFDRCQQTLPSRILMATAILKKVISKI